MDTLEAMETCRAMRYLRPDPVPDDLPDSARWFLPWRYGRWH